MKVFFVEILINGETVTGVVSGDSAGDVWVRVLKHYMDREDLILFLKEIREIEPPFFYLHGIDSKGGEN